MKKSAALMLIISIVLTSYFMTGCKHDLPGGNVNPPSCQGVTIDITTTAVPDTLAQSKGSINATATSGGNSFTYSIDGNTFQSSGAFTGLTAGTYTITAKNENGCTGTAQVNVGNYDPCSGVTITVTATKVDPTTGQSNGSITVTAPLGAGYTYSKDGGASYQSGTTFSNLPTGNYTIIAKNATGCTGSTTVTLGSVNPCTGVTITVVATKVDATTGQSNGSITVTSPVGAGYTYSKDGTNFQSGTTFSGLAAGAYTITAKNSNGCTGTTSVTVGSASSCTGVTISVTTTSTTAATTKCTSLASDYGSVTVSASGASGTFTYSKDGTTFQASSTFTSLAPGTYTITAKSAAGCTGTVQATVAYSPTTISFANSVSPNLQSCKSCHGNSYTTYSNVNANAKLIAGRLKGNTSPACNCVFNTNTTYGSFNMPSGSSLPTNWALTVFDQWVIQGKLNN